MMVKYQCKIMELYTISAILYSVHIWHLVSSQISVLVNHDVSDKLCAIRAEGGGVVIIVLSNILGIFYFI